MNVVVTGATKGIGKAIAERFAKEGANLALCSRSQDDLNRLKDSLERKFNVEALTVACDVSKKSEVQDFAAAIKEHWDTIDVLVNNAGMFIPGSTIEEDEGSLEKMIETNLYSAYHLTRALLPVMMPNKSGHIFNLCSVASLQAYPNGGSYSISKFALLGYSKALRVELMEHSIKVTSLIPGAVLTPSWEGVDLPESRFIDVSDVAELVWDVYSLSGRTVVEDLVIRPMLGDI